MLGMNSSCFQIFTISDFFSKTKFVIKKENKKTVKGEQKTAKHNLRRRTTNSTRGAFSRTTSSDVYKHRDHMPDLTQNRSRGCVVKLLFPRSFHNAVHPTAIVNYRNHV
jgi:hypothetical protein